MLKAKSNGFVYMEFGKLASVEVEEGYLRITNEEGHSRLKSKVYASWTSSKRHAEELIGKSIITRVPADRPFGAESWFADLFENREFTLYITESGKQIAKHHNLLQRPKDCGPNGHALMVSARIQQQQIERSLKRQQAWEVATVEEELQKLEEERENISAEDKENLGSDIEAVNAAFPQWKEHDKPVSFRIFGSAMNRGKLGHIDKQFAMRYRLDVTKFKRIQVAVDAQSNTNYIRGDIIFKNDPEPVPCIMAVGKRHETNDWIVKTVRPLGDAKRYMRLEKEIVGNFKDADYPLEKWFEIYDQINERLS